jgi:16S rRNA (uracil1498-N3)-methyltransferase
MHYFLDTNFTAEIPELSEEEAYHATKSLRLKDGDTVCVGNGKGLRFTGTLILKGKSNWEVSINKTETQAKPKPELVICIAPTKNPSRLEWFIEKSTEMGIDKIIPIETKRTERHRFKASRAERIVHAAAKQSLRWHLPEMGELVNVKELKFQSGDMVFMAHCEESYPRIECTDLLKYSSAEKVVILIGPEGDFTEEEIEWAQESGIKGLSLGSNRLRTETAGVFAASILSLQRSFKKS